MFDTEFSCEFVETDAPIDLGFLADGETVRVDKDGGDADEGLAEGGFGISISFEDGDAGEGG
jgi:hypothetical protein